MMLLAIVINLMLIPVVAFYLLRDWNIIVRRVGELLPRRWFAKARIIAIEIDDILAEFIRGQLWVMEKTQQEGGLQPLPPKPKQ